MPRPLTTAEKIKLQQALNDKLKPMSPIAVDGIFGNETMGALRVYQASVGHEVSGIPTDAEMITLGVNYAPTPKGTFMTIGNNWLSGIVTSTAFKYVVAIIAGFLAQKLGLDPTEGKATIEGALSGLVGVLMGLWGAYESSKSKVVVNGQAVQVKDMAPAAQAQVVAAVADAKGTTPAAILSK